MIFLEDRAPIALSEIPDWHDRIGSRAKALELEVGSGHGGFALAFARRHPDRALVAIEQRRAFAAALAQKAEERGHENLIVLCGDARLLAPRLFRKKTLAAIHVHFPDPWWKRRHKRRRLVDDGMSKLFFNLLAPGGRLDFRTDVEEYAASASAQFLSVGFESEARAGTFTGQDEIPSTREKRFLVSGEPVYRLRLRRPD